LAGDGDRIIKGTTLHNTINMDAWLFVAYNIMLTRTPHPASF